MTRCPRRRPPSSGRALLLQEEFPHALPTLAEAPALRRVTVQPLVAFPLPPPPLLPLEGCCDDDCRSSSSDAMPPHKSFLMKYASLSWGVGGEAQASRKRNVRGGKCFHQRRGGKFIPRRECDAGWGRKNRNSLSVAVGQRHDVRDAVALGAVQPDGHLVADAHMQSNQTGAVALMKVLVELPKEGRSDPEAPGVGAHGKGGHVPVPLTRLLRLRRRILMPMPTEAIIPLDDLLNIRPNRGVRAVKEDDPQVDETS